MSDTRILLQHLLYFSLCFLLPSLSSLPSLVSHYILTLPNSPLYFFVHVTICLSSFLPPPLLSSASFLLVLFLPLNHLLSPLLPFHFSHALLPLPLPTFPSAFLLALFLSLLNPFPVPFFHLLFHVPQHPPSHLSICSTSPTPLYSLLFPSCFFTRLSPAFLLMPSSLSSSSLLHFLFVFFPAPNLLPFQSLHEGQVGYKMSIP